MIAYIPSFLILLPFGLLASPSLLPLSNKSVVSTGQIYSGNPAMTSLNHGTELGLNLAEWEVREGQIQRLWSINSQNGNSQEGQDAGHAMGLQYLSGSGPYQARFDLAWGQNWASFLSPGLRLSYIASGNLRDHVLLDAGFLIRPWPYLLTGYWSENLWTGGFEERSHHATLALRPLALSKGALSDLHFGVHFMSPDASQKEISLFSQLPVFPGIRLMGEWELKQKQGALGLVFQLGSHWTAGFGLANSSQGRKNPQGKVSPGLAKQGGMSFRQDHRIPYLGLGRKVAELNLNTRIIEGRTPERWFGSASDLGFLDLLSQFDVLDASPEIRSVILKLGRAQCGWAMAEEIRRRIVRLQTSGKRVVAYLDQVSPLNYFLASGATVVAVQPQGYFAVIGLSAEVTFYRGFFDKVGVEPQFLRHGKFKSFEEPYMRTGFSEPARTDLTEYLASLWNHYLEVVSASRKLPKDSLRRILESGEISLVHAQKFGLIDTLLQADQVLNLAGGPQARLVSNLPAKVYHFNWNLPPKIALVTVTGDMVSGQSSKGWLAGRDLAGSETVARQLRQARLTPGVRAVVLRVDSPGGSAQAADIMTREIELLKEAHIPVIASVGHSAASGGYYLICGADKIFAEPNSTVGSIGVLWGKFILKGLYDKLGLKVEAVKTSPHADGNSMNRPWDSTEVEILQRYMDQFYSDFVTRVAAGRRRTKDGIDSLGQGRIFTGTQALKNGLVDQLGGLEDALSSAKILAGLKPHEPFELEYISPKNANSSFASLGQEWSHAPTGLAKFAEEWERLSSLAQPGLWAVSPEMSGWMGIPGPNRE